MRTLISSTRAVSLKDETDKTDENQMLRKVIWIIGDTKFLSSLNSLHNSDRLKYTYSIVKDVISKWNNDNTSERTKKKSLTLLKKTVLPILLIVFNDLVDASKIVPSIADTRYAHACHEVDRRKSTDNNNILRSGKRKRSPVKRIEMIITKNKENIIHITPDSNRKSTRDKSSN